MTSMTKGSFLVWAFIAFAMMMDRFHVVEADEANANDYLYGNDDEATPILEFDGEDVDFRFTNEARVVLFYNPFCGHCIQYKPKYISLARQTQEIMSNLKFYAVSCSVHAKVCSENKITGVPTAILMASSKDHNHELPIHTTTHLGLAKLAHVMGRKNPQKPSEISDSMTISKKRTLKRYSADSEDDDEDDDDNNAGDEHSEDEDDDGDSNESGDGDDDDEGGDDDDEGGDDDDEGGDDDEGNDDGQGGDDDDEGGDDDEGNDDGQGNDDDEGNDDGQVNDDGQGDDDDQGNDDDYKQGKRIGAVGGADDDSAGDDDGNGGDDDSAGGDDDSAGDDDDAVQDDDHNVPMAKSAKFANQGGRDEYAFDYGKQMGKGDKWFMSPPDSESDDKSKWPRKGANLARDSPSDMNKWRKELAERKKSIRTRPFQRPYFGADEDDKSSNDDPGEPTEKMKAHTPGTQEYKQRIETIQARIDEIMKRQRLRNQERANGKDIHYQGEGRPQIADTLKPPKYKKAVKKKNFLARQAERAPVIKHIVKMTPEEELILDVSLSFITALKSGPIFTDDVGLPQSKKTALLSWFQLLSVSLPPEWGLHDLIGELMDNMDNISLSNENLMKVLSRHPVHRPYWSSSCSKAKSPGFSCGFWKLLHLVSIGVAEHKGGKNLIDAGLVSHSTRSFSPSEAANTIYDYIRSFYPCDKCRNHFVAQYDQCSNRRCERLADDVSLMGRGDWQELAKWLWEVHNDVNVKILHDNHRTESKRFFQGQKKEVTKADEVTVLFPTLDTCIQCFKDDGSFEEDAVFLYLERVYWLGSDLDGKAERILHFEEAESMGASYFWFFVLMIILGGYYVRKYGVNSVLGPVMTKYRKKGRSE